MPFVAGWGSGKLIGDITGCNGWTFLLVVAIVACATYLAVVSGLGPIATPMPRLMTAVAILSVFALAGAFLVVCWIEN